MFVPWTSIRTAEPWVPYLEYSSVIRSWLSEYSSARKENGTGDLSSIGFQIGIAGSGTPSSFNGVAKNHLTVSGRRRAKGDLQIPGVPLLDPLTHLGIAHRNRTDAPRRCSSTRPPNVAPTIPRGPASPAPTPSRSRPARTASPSTPTPSSSTPGLGVSRC